MINLKPVRLCMLQPAIRGLLSGILITCCCVKGFSQLSFHNTATENVYLAVKYIDNGVWKTQGWFKVGPLQTEKIFPAINNRYYYYYAFTDNRKLVWSGKDSYAWAHRKDAFTTREDQRYLPANGYEKIELRMIDVGQAKNYTYTLDFRTQFVTRLEAYFAKGNLDAIEGMYSVSDEIITETHAGAGQVITATEKKDHWAKVAIIRDTLSVSRNYIEFVIEADELKEGQVRTEFLKTAQSNTIFMSEQKLKPKGEPKSIVLEFHADAGILEGKFEYAAPRKKYRVKRSYLKYFPNADD